MFYLITLELIVNVLAFRSYISVDFVLDGCINFEGTHFTDDLRIVIGCLLQQFFN